MIMGTKTDYLNEQQACKAGGGLESRIEGLWIKGNVSKRRPGSETKGQRKTKGDPARRGLAVGWMLKQVKHEIIVRLVFMAKALHL